MVSQKTLLYLLRHYYLHLISLWWLGRCLVVKWYWPHLLNVGEGILMDLRAPTWLYVILFLSGRFVDLDKFHKTQTGHSSVLVRPVFHYWRGKMPRVRRHDYYIEQETADCIKSLCMVLRSLSRLLSYVCHLTCLQYFSKHKDNV